MTQALVVVAHPDDCIIFALGIIHRCPDWQWEIAYLTYNPTTTRGQEISAFWRNRNISTHWLDYADDWRDIERGEPSFDTQQAARDIAKLVEDYDIVVTHDANGDYGHPHHRFVNQAACAAHDNIITFSPFGQGNLYIKLPDNLYSLSEIPEHYKSVGDFISPVNRQNEYHVPEHLKSFL